MKNFFNKFRSYSFWVSLSGAIIILLNAFGRAFGFKIENQIVEDCIMAVAGVLVVLGVCFKTPNGETNEKDESDSDNEVKTESQDESTENVKKENNEDVNKNS
ncbi:MAG: hypothetical protein ACI4R8_03840 [Candidatus Caccovivens sp.]